MKDEAWLLIVGLAAICVYFLPLIVASMRSHPSEGAIGALNLFLGWTFLGWVVSLVWALTGGPKPDADEAAGSADTVPLEDTKPCPDCAERVLVAAKVCRFCRHTFAEAETAPVSGAHR